MRSVVVLSRARNRRAPRRLVAWVLYYTPSPLTKMGPLSLDPNWMYSVLYAWKSPHLNNILKFQKPSTQTQKVLYSLEFTELQQNNYHTSFLLNFTMLQTLSRLSTHVSYVMQWMCIVHSWFFSNKLFSLMLCFACWTKSEYINMPSKLQFSFANTKKVHVLLFFRLCQHEIDSPSWIACLATFRAIIGGDRQIITQTDRRKTVGYIYACVCLV